MSGFCTIVISCYNLIGLKLLNTHAGSLDLVKLWEILSVWQLIYLSIGHCLIVSDVDTSKQQKVVSLYKKCSTLQATEIGSQHTHCAHDNTCEYRFFPAYHMHLKYCTVVTYPMLFRELSLVVSN